jgi:hypothetical protein
MRYVTNNAAILMTALMIFVSCTFAGSGELGAGIIPQPATMAILGFAGFVLHMTRRRK